MIRSCGYCKEQFEDHDRVIYSTRETFIFKPADVQDEPVVIQGKHGPQEVSAAAVLSPEALKEQRKAHLRTAIVNVFVDWGKADVPEGAFNFRHQWCEPQRTGANGSLHPVNKHAARFNRSMPRRLHG